MIGTCFVRSRPAHQLGELEAVHARHLHVEQRKRDVVLEQKLERLLTISRFQNLEIVAAQKGFERDEIFFAIVHQEKLDLRFGSVAHGRTTDCKLAEPVRNP